MFYMENRELTLERMTQYVHTHTFSNNTKYEYVGVDHESNTKPQLPNPENYSYYQHLV